MKALRMPLLALAAGCAASPEVSRSARGATEESYQSVLKHWTRDGQMMHQVDTALEVGATYKSWEFRSAYVERRAALFKLPEARRLELEQTERAEHGKGHEFYVAAATHREQWNDLDRPESAWRVALVCDDRREVEPLRVHRHRKITVATQSFFPYTGTFSYGYALVFPRSLPDGTPVCGPGTRRMTLRFAGPLGTLQLAWDLH